jgi:hypothetical protein
MLHQPNALEELFGHLHLVSSVSCQFKHQSLNALYQQQNEKCQQICQYNAALDIRKTTA